VRRLLPRRPVLVLAAVTALPTAVVALPVLTPPAAHPKPVAPAVHNLDAAQASAGVTGRHFDLVGAHWRRDALPAGAKLQVQVHQDGRWSGWNDLPGADGGPDGGSADAVRAAHHNGDTVNAEPLWVGNADGVRTRVVNAAGGPVATPADTHVVLVDGGSSAADASVVRGDPAASAYAQEAQPVIHTRAQWGADESLRTNACPQGPDYASTVRVGFVHHTDTSNSYAPSDVPAIIRSIYAYHVQSNGWCDIGYNFLVDQFGNIWEGRYGGITKAVIGAHTGGFNTESFGVAMIGTFQSTTPPAAMTDAVARLMAWRLGLANRDPAGRGVLTAGSFSESHCVVNGSNVSPCPVGTRVTFNAISGHRDADLTSCPGDAGYATLPGLRTKARQYLGLGMVDPGLSGGSPVYGDGGSVSIVAGLLGGPAAWTLRVTDRATGLPVQVDTGTASTVVRATWDRRTIGGLLALPGTYDLRVDVASATDTAVPVLASVTVKPPVGTTFIRGGSAVAKWAEGASSTGGAAGTSLSFGSTLGVPLAGDWDGAGVDTPAMVQASGTSWVWHIADRSGTEVTSFTAGSTSCVPVAGDWDGDGRTTAGVACPAADGWHWQLWNSADGSGTPVTVTYGDPAGYPVTGDWDGDHHTGLGTVAAQSDGLHWHLTDSSTPGSGGAAPTTAYDVVYGAPTAIPVTGDWNGDGKTGIGVATPTNNGLQWSLSDQVVSATPSGGFVFGGLTDVPVPGRWTGGATKVGAVTLGATTVIPPPRPITDACPSGTIRPDSFQDIPSTDVHAAAIACVVQWKVANGVTSTSYQPGALVTREQMAAFIARLVRASGGTLPTPTKDYFGDDNTSPFKDDINALAAAGIVNGTGTATFSPTTKVLRSQMAAFLVRAYDYRAQQAGLPALAAGPDVFQDGNGDALESAINTAAAAGFTGGYPDGTYRPNAGVQRDEMASFLARVLALAVDQKLATVPS